MPVDQSIIRCTICGVEFTFLRRRHWCRTCGRTICYNCSANLSSSLSNLFKKRHVDNTCIRCFSAPPKVGGGSPTLPDTSTTTTGGPGGASATKMPTGTQRVALPTPPRTPTPTTTPAQRRAQSSGANASSCAICKSEFTFMNRRLSCRMCLRTICNVCSCVPVSFLGRLRGNANTVCCECEALPTETITNTRTVRSGIQPSGQPSSQNKPPSLPTTPSNTDKTSNAVRMAPNSNRSFQGGTTPVPLSMLPPSSHQHGPIGVSNTSMQGNPTQAQQHTMARSFRAAVGSFVPQSVLCQSMVLGDIREVASFTGRSLVPSAGAIQLGPSVFTPSAWQRYFLTHFSAAASDSEKSLVSNHVLTFTAEGTLQVDHLSACIQIIAERHSLIRSMVTDSAIVIADLSQTPTTVDFKAYKGRESQRRVLDELYQPFQSNATSGKTSFFRVRISELSENEHFVGFAMDRMIGDIASLGIILQDLRVLYQNVGDILTTKEGSGRRVLELNRNAVQRVLPSMDEDFSAFASWEAAYTTTAEPSRQYWGGVVSDVGEYLLEVPTDHPKTAQQTFAAKSTTIHIPPLVIDALQGFGVDNSTNLSNVLLTAYVILLQRYSGQEDITIAVPVQNRIAQQWEDVVGPLSNYIVVRPKITETSDTASLCRQIRQIMNDSLAHQAFPISELADKYASGVKGRFPFAQASFVDESFIHVTSNKFHLAPFLYGVDGFVEQWAGLKLTSTRPKVKLPFEGTTGTLFDITLHIHESRGETYATFIYPTKLFNDDTFERMKQNYLTLLESFSGPVTTIRAAPMVSSSELEKLMVDFNKTELPLSTTVQRKNRGVHALVEAMVEQHSSTTALIMPEENVSMTFAELNAKANKLAWALKTKYGAKRDTVVALCMNRSVTLMMALLAVLKSGSAYLPLDSSYPVDRLQFMLADSDAIVVLTSAKIMEELPELFKECKAPSVDLFAQYDELTAGQPTTNPDVELDPDSLAYVIYTSGSTGKPKGVMMRHGALINLVLWQNDYLPRRESQKDDLRVLQFSPISFDVSFQETVSTWALGGTMYCISEQLRLDSLNLLRYIHNNKINRIFLPFVALNHLAEMAEETKEAPRCLTDIITAGEQLVISRSLIWLHELLGDETVLHNHYGPSETHVCSFYVCKGNPRTWPTLPPIGIPISNTQLYVVDDQRVPLPIGVNGELYIGGDCLGRGYLKRPDTTAATFVANPFGPPGSLMYKTGDLVRMKADGNIDYLRRKDSQVKVRGFRIELGEIEAQLGLHDAVRKCAVIVREDTPGDKRLVGYVVIAPGTTVQSLKDFLKQRLPDYMVPPAFVVMEALPLAPSGKVNRKGLPPPSQDMSTSNATYVPPQNPIEQQLAEIWMEILKVPRVGHADNFFDLGGHSLTITKMCTRVKTVFGVEVPLSTAFNAPTLNQLAKCIADEKATGVVSVEQQAEVVTDPTYELTFNQLSMLFLNEAQPDYAGMYNIVIHGKIVGDLNIDLLQSAMKAIVKNHASLRTTYHKDIEGRYMQAIQRPDDDSELVDFNISDFVQPLEADEIQEILSQESSRPFDLSKDVLFRARLFRFTTEEIIQFNFHHIATDLWSLALIFEDLRTIMRGQRLVPKRGLSYADYAKSMNDKIRSRVGENMLASWRSALKIDTCTLPVLELPTDGPRPAIQSYAGDLYTFKLSKEITEKLNTVCRSYGSTMYTLLLSIYATLLHKFSSQDDIVIGTPMGGRTTQTFEHVVGYFINSVPMYVSFGDDPTFQDLLGQCRAKALHALANQEYPFPLLVDNITGAQRSMSHSPVFQTLFILQKPPSFEEIVPFIMYQEGYKMSLAPNLEIESVVVPTHMSMFDIVVQFAELEGQLSCSVEYNTDLFAESTIKRMFESFTVLASTIAENMNSPCSQLGFVSPSMEKRVKSDFNNTESVWTDFNMSDPAQAVWPVQFDRMAKSHENGIAVEYSWAGQSTYGSLTFGKLRRLSNGFAAYLRQQHGVGVEDIVGVSLRKGLPLAVSLIAVQKAGAAFVPIDPLYPSDRIVHMARDSQAKVILTTSEYAHLYPDSKLIFLDKEFDNIKEMEEAPITGLQSFNKAYVIYTSGSTGLPKGTVLEHKGMCNICSAIEHSYRFTKKQSKMLWFASASFDASVLEFFAPLFLGCASVMLSQDAMVGQDLSRAMTTAGITHAVLPPSVLGTMTVEFFPPPSLTHLVTAGEAITLELVQRWRKSVTLLNAYGPTENAVASTVCAYDEDRVVLLGTVGSENPPEDAIVTKTPPIGRPIHNYKCYIVDANLNLLPIGVPGELIVTGPGLARCYLHQPVKTAMSFVPNPFDSNRYPRMYRTGDLVRWIEGGLIEYSGRIDFQVKIRGYRIELGEIEAVLEQHQTVLNCVVEVRAEKGEKQLVGYMVLRPECPPPTVSELRAHLKAKLPDYMIPASFVRMESLPVNPSGKVDRKALPPPSVAGTSVIGAETTTEATMKVAPRSATEAALILLFKEVLGLDSIGVNDSFFELGGHSLAALQLVSRVRENFGVEMPLAKVFELPTVIAMSESIDSVRQADTEVAPLKHHEDLVMESLGSPGTHVPLSYNQESLWFGHLIQPDSAMYNVVFASRISSKCDNAAFEKAMKLLCLAHPALTASFGSHDSTPFQVFYDTVDRCDFKHVNVGNADNASIEQRIIRDAHLPYDLTKDRILKVWLYCDDAGLAKYFLLTIHHIAADLISMETIVDHLGVLYSKALEEGSPLALSPADCIQKVTVLEELALCTFETTYGDYALWQREVMASPYGESLFSYWQRQLAGCVTTLNLPTDRPRPEFQTFHGNNHVLTLSPAILQSMRKFAKQQSTTLFTVLSASLFAWLFRVTNQEDILVGTPVAGRTRMELENLVGDFINLVVLRGLIEDNGQISFKSFLKQMRSTVINALMYQDYPFGLLVQRMQQHRETSRSPLFQVLFVHEKVHHTHKVLTPFMMGEPGGKMKLADIELESMDLKQKIAQYDLVFAIAEYDNDRMDVTLQYNSDLFHESTIANFGRQWVVLLETALNNPHTHLCDLPLMSDTELNSIVEGMNKTYNPYPAVTNKECVHQRFELAASNHSSNFAVSDPKSNIRWTYDEFNRRANKLARYLQKAIGTPNQTGMLFVPRSAHYVLFLVAYAKAGMPYLPLDVAIPMDRMEYIVGDSGAAVILTTSKSFSKLKTLTTTAKIIVYDEIESDLEAEDSSNLALTTTWESTVYTIYTSGSTGKPKGVDVHHGGCVHLVQHAINQFKMTDKDVICQILGAAFDPVTMELWPALCSGAEVVIIDDETKLSGVDKIMEFFVKYKVSFVVLPTALADGFIHLPPSPGLVLRVLTCGGDRLRGVGTPLPYVFINCYGPTETSVMCTTYQTHGSHVPETFQPGALYAPNPRSVDPPIGKAISNSAVYVLDKLQRPVPVGYPGELYVTGAGVAIGYKNKPEQTTKVFIPDTITPSGNSKVLQFALQPPRMYRTGDLVRINPTDGQIDFIGRVDFQVKIRGFRIELGEIESVILSYQGIAETACIVKQDKLIAFYVRLADSTVPAPTTTELKKYCQTKLPEYMTPSAFIEMEKFPLTTNNKVDRQFLSTQVTELPQTQVEEVQPTNDVETRICGMWKEILNIPSVGILDNWFDRGGSSLASTLLLAKMRSTFHMEISLAQFFSSPTVKGLAQVVQAQGNLEVADNIHTILLNDASSLDADIVPLSGAVPEYTTNTVKFVFLTGATGFLGAFILVDLLKRSTASVYCLVRAKTEDEGKKRIVDNVTKYDPSFAAMVTTEGHRILPVIGDLGKPLLGMSSAVYDEVCKSVDVIIHNGALVNFSYPYMSMKAANVDGTKVLLRMACRNKQKLFHYVSTLSVLPHGVTSEEMAPETPNGLEGGYTQTKWVAERIIHDGYKRGIPITVSRPGRITGHSVTGATNTDDFLILMVKGCVQMGLAPRFEMPIEINPVDYCSQSIVEISCNNHYTRSLSVLPVFHLHNPNMVSWEEFLSVLKSQGYPSLKLDTYAKWRQTVMSLTDKDHNALMPLVPQFSADFEKEVGHVDLYQVSAIRTITTAPSYEGLDYGKTLQIYVKFLIDAKFLPKGN